MKISLSLTSIGVSAALLLTGCHHFAATEILAPIGTAGPDEQTANDTVGSASLPDMPTWVKFVRFKPHTHDDNVESERQGEPHDQTAHNFHGEQPQRADLKSSVLSVTSFVSSPVDQAEAFTSPVERGVAINPEQQTPCMGEGGYVDLQNERWLSERDGDRWTIQLVSADDASEPCIDQYLADLNVTEARRYAVFFKGSIWHIALIGDYPTVEAAIEASKKYSDPWVRNFADVRERRCASVRRVHHLDEVISRWCNQQELSQTSIETRLRNRVPLL